MKLKQKTKLASVREENEEAEKAKSVSFAANGNAKSEVKAARERNSINKFSLGCIPA